jgi:hypothetical protein
VISDGEVLYMTSDADMRAAIGRYRDRGFRTMVSLDVVTATADGEIAPATPLPTDSEFIKLLLDEVGELAALAEAEDVDLYGALNEPDVRLGEAARAFAGQQLAISQAHFWGPIIWKGGADTSIVVEGYDIVGGSLGAPDDANADQIRHDTRITLDGMRAQAASSGVDSLMVTEFGLWHGDFSTWSDERKSVLYEEVFDYAPDLDGYFVFDGPEGYDMPLADSPGEAVVTNWYLNGL